MQASKIPVVKVSRGAASGTPEEFEQRFERDRKRKSAQRQQVEHKPTLPEIENKSMRERLANLAIEES